jgi:dihydrofolate reductase
MRLLVQKGKYQASVSTVEGTIMGRIIIIEFISLDGVVDDPDGEDGQEFGGWAFRHGPEAVAGDKFNMGELLDTCILVLGRVTWEKFSGFWPGREDEFSRKMNAMPKLVVSRSLDNASAWEHSGLLTGDLVKEIAKLKQTQDVVVTGSLSVVPVLRANDLIDQYRLLVFPEVVGRGRRLFDDQHIDLKLKSVETAGEAVRLIYDRTQVV